MSRTAQSAYFSPKLEVRSCPKKGGLGVFAIDLIRKDDVLVVWGGDVMTIEQMADLPLHLQHLSIQVEEEGRRRGRDGGAGGGGRTLPAPVAERSRRNSGSSDSFAKEE